MQYGMTNHIIHHMAFQPIYPFITQLRSNNTILQVSILRYQNHIKVKHEFVCWASKYILLLLLLLFRVQIKGIFLVAEK